MEKSGPLWYTEPNCALPPVEQTCVRGDFVGCFCFGLGGLSDDHHHNQPHNERWTVGKKPGEATVRGHMRYRKIHFYYCLLFGWLCVKKITINNKLSLTADVICVDLHFLWAVESRFQEKNKTCSSWQIKEEERSDEWATSRHSKYGNKTWLTNCPCMVIRWKHCYYPVMQRCHDNGQQIKHLFLENALILVIQLHTSVTTVDATMSSYTPSMC